MFLRLLHCELRARKGYGVTFIEFRSTRNVTLT